MNRLPQYGYLLLLASLFVSGFYFVMQRNERVKKNWPTVLGRMRGDATILQTTKAYLQTPTATVTARDDRYLRDEKVWALKAEYEYEVAGQSYTGMRATATDHVDAVSDYPKAPSQQMEQWKEQLLKGSTVTTHYDPAEPTESYLIYTESAALKTILMTACALMLLGVVLAVVPRLFS